jgi:hypothetical protein
VQNFRKSVIAHHQIRECLGDYDKKFEDPLLHTYSAITNFVSTHLPNIRASAGLSSSATTSRAFHMTSTDIPATAPLNMSMTEMQVAYSALEHKFKSLQGQKRPGNGRGKNGKRQEAISSLKRSSQRMHASFIATRMATRIRTILANAKSWPTNRKTSTLKCVNH